MAVGKSDKFKYIRIAAVTAIVGNTVLAILKIITGIRTDSAALLGDGIDSSTDVLIGIITLVISKIISKPADVAHPWGHGRAETISTVLLSFIIFFAGAQLITSSVSSLFSGNQQYIPSMTAIIIALISIAGKSLLAWSQYLLGKRADSIMIKANAKNMAGDVVISFGVLAGLSITAVTVSAYADTIISILIGAWIVKTAVGIFLEANVELMDGNYDMEPYRVIVHAVNSVEGANNPHRARIRRIAGFWDIDFDIDVAPECTVLEAHGIASQIEKEIKKNLENVFDIMIHMEPLGDNTAEVFGLSENEIRGDKTD